MIADTVIGYTVTNTQIKLLLTNGDEFLGTLNTKTTKRVSKFFTEEMEHTDFFVLTNVVRRSDNERFDVLIFNKNHVLHIAPMPI